MDSTSKPCIMVVAETDSQGVKPVTYELVAFALELERLACLRVEVVAVGGEMEGAAGAIAARTGLPVSAVCARGFRGFTAAGMTAVLAAVLPGRDPAFVLAAHTSQGQDYLPALAVALDGECITGVEGIDAGEEGIRFSRSLLGGKAVARVRSSAERTLLTLQPGVFPAVSGPAPTAGPVERIDIAWPEEKVRSLGIQKGEAEFTGVAEAEVVVGAGRGIGGPENLALIERLAALFPKSAVAGSRPVCDAGWLAYRQQVGVTGATIAPELYIACGISGAVQHLGGVRGAGCIVAVNRDPKAAIFNMADIVVVEDLTAFIPAFLAAAAEDGDETGRE